jgi:hypothetical protein
MFRVELIGVTCCAALLSGGCAASLERTDKIANDYNRVFSVDTGEQPGDRTHRSMMPPFG